MRRGECQQDRESDQSPLRKGRDGRRRTARQRERNQGCRDAGIALRAPFDGAEASRYGHAQCTTRWTNVCGRDLNLRDKSAGAVESDQLRRFAGVVPRVERKAGGVGGCGGSRLDEAEDCDHPELVRVEEEAAVPRTPAHHDGIDRRWGCVEQYACCSPLIGEHRAAWHGQAACGKRTEIDRHGRYHPSPERGECEKQESEKTSWRTHAATPFHVKPCPIR